jgi:hypothetical protein
MYNLQELYKFLSLHTILQEARQSLIWVTTDRDENRAESFQLFHENMMKQKYGNGNRILWNGGNRNHLMEKETKTCFLTE